MGEAQFKYRVPLSSMDWILYLKIDKYLSIPDKGIPSLMTFASTSP